MVVGYTIYVPSTFEILMSLPAMCSDKPTVFVAKNQFQ